MSAEKKQGAIQPAFSPGEIVSHISDDGVRGCVVAFMVRGQNHSYQIQWSVEKCEWHMDFELVRKPDKPKEIGFWSEGQQ